MTFIDTRTIEPWERRPGWRGRHFDSSTMSFAYWDFDAGSDIHEHSHPQEEVWHIIEGELTVTINGISQTCGPNTAAIVPSNTPHAVLATRSGRAIVVDYPLRRE